MLFDFYTKEYRAYQPRIYSVMCRGQDYLKSIGQFETVGNYLPFATFDDDDASMLHMHNYSFKVA